MHGLQSLKVVDFSGFRVHTFYSLAKALSMSKTLSQRYENSLPVIYEIMLVLF